MTDRIAALARRVEDEEFFLASVLADYARTENLDDQGLAEKLSCPVKTLVSLRLCLRPSPDPDVFRREVDRIASRFEVDAGLLAEAIRRSDALRIMRSKADAEEGGLLMAARDRREEDPEGERS
ncbi:MAG: hypothetical protein LC781_16115 [Actinobacteria bacterium]|nr:hypothetical protein [Actinomycetota bacterium]MCA1718273.1 hypothetical protein [Actinomycetota bacterium]